MNDTEPETRFYVSSIILYQDPWSLSLSNALISWSLLIFSLGFPHSVAEAVCTLRDHHLPEWAGKKHSTY